MGMEVSPTFTPGRRSEWRRWLEAHHAVEAVVWVLVDRAWRPGAPPRPGGLTYLDVVEECLCFGWIDGLAKTHEGLFAQRTTPRRRGGNWTELNKERCRRLIAAGRMTPAGRAALPDLDAPWAAPPPVLEALRADPAAWARWVDFPPIYQRVRAGYVAEVERRDPAEYARRLASLLEKTRAGVMFGNWDDAGLPVTPTDR